MRKLIKITLCLGLLLTALAAPMQADAKKKAKDSSVSQLDSLNSWKYALLNSDVCQLYSLPEFPLAMDSEQWPWITSDPKRNPQSYREELRNYQRKILDLNSTYDELSIFPPFNYLLARKGSVYSIIDPAYNRPLVCIIKFAEKPQLLFQCQSKQLIAIGTDVNSNDGVFLIAN